MPQDGQSDNIKYSCTKSEKDITSLDKWLTQNKKEIHQYSFPPTNYIFVSEYCRASHYTMKSFHAYLESNLHPPISWPKFHPPTIFQLLKEKLPIILLFFCWFLWLITNELISPKPITPVKTLLKLHFSCNINFRGQDGWYLLICQTCFQLQTQIVHCILLQYCQHVGWPWTEMD